MPYTITDARDEIGPKTEHLTRIPGEKLVTSHNWVETRTEPRANKLQMLAG